MSKRTFDMIEDEDGFGPSNSLSQQNFNLLDDPEYRVISEEGDVDSSQVIKEKVTI